MLDILTLVENQEAILNGVSGMGRGLNDIPGSIVSVDTAPSQERNITEMSARVTNPADVSAEVFDDEDNNINDRHRDESVSNAAKTMTSVPQFPSTIGGPVVHSPIIPSALLSVVGRPVPPVIWVIGGPGSNKAMLCIKAVALNPGWAHFR